MNLENAIIDIFDDVHLEQTLEKVATRLPDNIKSQEMPTFEERDTYMDTAFAISIITKTAGKLNKYPINTTMNTAMSNEYFDLCHHNLPIEAQKVAASNIKAACGIHGIIPCESVEKVASGPTVNIYVEPYNAKPGGPIVKRASDVKPQGDHFYALEGKYAMPSPEYVTKAVDYFNKYAGQFTAQERFTYAHNVSARAKELGVPVEDTPINKYAGHLYSPDLRGAILARKGILPEDSPYMDSLDKLASMQSEILPSDFAQVLHEVDKQAGLDKYYDKYLADPFWSTLGSMEKKANMVYEQHGKRITQSDMESALLEKRASFDKYFGSSLIDGLSKGMPDAFTSLPDDVKDTMASIAYGEIK